MTGAWNADVTGGNPYTATPLGWNNLIQPGQSIEFGVQGVEPGDVPGGMPSSGIDVEDLEFKVETGVGEMPPTGEGDQGKWVGLLQQIAWPRRSMYDDSPG